MIDRALLDVADLMKPYTHLSGSIVYLIKLNPATDISFSQTESEIISLLNIRNIRLVTVELGVNTEDFNLQRISDPVFTNSFYNPVINITSFGNTMDIAAGNVLQLVNENKYESLNMQVGWLYFDKKVWSILIYLGHSYLISRLEGTKLLFFHKQTLRNSTQSI